MHGEARVSYDICMGWPIRIWAEYLYGSEQFTQNSNVPPIGHASQSNSNILPTYVEDREKDEGFDRWYFFIIAHVHVY